MPSFRSGTVDAITDERTGLQRVLVDGEPAYVLTELIGAVGVGDRVVMNTTAVELGLGTGGWHVVHWNLSRDAWSSPAVGREMKVRYTSLQSDVAVAVGEDVPTVPVVVCLLHSQVAAVAVGYTRARPDARLAYVMTDGGALPLAVSDLVARLRAEGLITGTVTAGNAFGGDLEATTIDHALAATAAFDPTAIVVAMGPGGLGVGNPLAFSGRDAAAAAVRAAARPVVAVRYSDADPRPRHQGVSYHTRDLLDLISGDVAVPIPAGEPDPAFPGCKVTEVDVPDLVPELTRLEVSSMGRRPSEDPRFWAYAGAAGVLAAQPNT